MARQRACVFQELRLLQLRYELPALCDITHNFPIIKPSRHKKELPLLDAIKHTIFLSGPRSHKLKQLKVQNQWPILLSSSRPLSYIFLLLNTFYIKVFKGAVKLQFMVFNAKLTFGNQVESLFIPLFPTHISFF